MLRRGTTRRGLLFFFPTREGTLARLTPAVFVSDILRVDELVWSRKRKREEKGWGWLSFVDVTLTDVLD